jgi:hypothetical protein
MVAFLLLHATKAKDDATRETKYCTQPSPYAKSSSERSSVADWACTPTWRVGRDIDICYIFGFVLQFKHLLV